MSRLGKLPLVLDDNVSIDIDGQDVKTRGPLGEIRFKLNNSISAKLSDGELLLTRKSDTKEAKAQHGLAFSVIKNNIYGVTKGFKKELELVGVGFRVQLSGAVLNFSLGYSHPVKYEAPEGIKFEVEGTNIIKVQGIDKHLVGQISANLVDLRKPDSYKGKGVRYVGQVLQLKQGKSVKK